MITNSLLFLRRRLETARASAEAGFAMVIVLGMATVMTALLGGALLYATSTSQGGSTDDVNYTLAYNAAVAGVNDFTARMNLDKSYCTKVQAAGDTDTFSTPANPAWTSWVSVPGNSGSKYHYKRLTDCNIGTGDTSDIKIQVTGIAGPATGPNLPEVRTLTAEIKRPGFRDYVFFTDKEEGDPSLPEYGFSATTQNSCRVYEWALPSSQNNRPSTCKDLSFLAGDVLNGKVHTNDIIRTSGTPSFEAQVTEGCPGILSGQPCYSTAGSVNTGRFINGSGTPNWNGLTIQTGVTLAFPADDSSVEAAANAGGCVYRGPTRIVLLNTGKMSIASPKSTATAACPLGTNVSLPSNGVMFVKSIGPSDTGYSATCGAAPWVTNPTTSGNANSGGTSYPLANDWDVTKGYTTCNDGNLWIEGTLDGIADIGTENDVYVTGDIKYKDGLTGASANDGLGLVAQNAIAFYHPIGTTVTAGTLKTAGFCTRVSSKATNPSTTKTAETTQAHCTGTLRNITSASSVGEATAANCSPLNTSTNSSSYCNYGTWTAPVYNPDTSVDGELCPDPCGHDLSISAAMLSVSHSIYLPYFDQSYTDTMGTLTINGSVAQFYRGPVKSGTHGFTKSYNYDPRLVNIILPGFPEPTSGYGSNQFTDGQPTTNGGCFGINASIVTGSGRTDAYGGAPSYRTSNASGSACP